MESTVAPRPLRIGWNVPGTFARLGLHMGMLIAWLNAGLPLPSLVVATSAGAIFSACCISFDRKVVRRVARIIRYLKREQIYVLSHGLIRVGVYLLTAGGMLLITATSAGSLGWQWTPLLFILAVLPAYTRFRGTRLKFIASTIVLLVTAAFAAWKSSGWTSATVFCLGLFFVDWLVRRAVSTFFKECASPLDNKPLHDLLMRECVAQSALRADAELRIIAADVAVPEGIIYSNHDRTGYDPENPMHCEQFVDGAILGSSALPGRFNLRVIRGKTPRDGEVWTDYPVHQFSKAKNNGVKFDVVFRFDYWPPLMPGRVPQHWLADLFRCFDVMRDRATDIKMEEYRLEREKDPELPKVVNIRASARLLEQMPELAVYSFKPGQLWRAMKIGRLILRENLPMIRRELGLAVAV